VDAAFAARLAAALREKLCGKAPGEIGAGALDGLRETFGANAWALAPIWDFLWNVLREFDENAEALHSGAANMLRFPEYADLERARDFLEFLDDRKRAAQTFEGEGGGALSIRIGSENPVEIPRDCSVVRADYFMRGRVAGKLALIGPTRMDYARILARMRALSRYLNDLFDERT
jgi:heat-inducible transcriptional repressor